jgi:hypothetical protein
VVNLAQPVAGQRQRPPGGTQRDPDRRPLRAVPGHVADQRRDRPVGQLQGVVEIRADQRSPLAGPVACLDRQARIVQRQRGQQPTLQLACQLGLDVGLGEALVPLALFGHVLEHHGDARRPAAAVVHHPSPAGQQPDVAGGADDPLLLAERGPVDRGTADGLDHARPVVGVEAGDEGLQGGGRRLRVEPADPAQLSGPADLVGADLPLEAAESGDGLRLGELLLTLAQHALGFPLGRHVLGNLGEAVQLPVIVVERGDGGVRVEAAAVLADTPSVSLEAVLARRLRQRLGRQARGTVLFGIETREMLTENLGSCVPFDPLCALVPAHHAAARVEQEDRVVLDALDQQPELLGGELARAAHPLGTLPRRCHR